jgi:hypothetical protein
VASHMLHVLVLGLMALQAVDDRDSAVTLIGRLGAQSFDDRVAAYKALERLGREALPALRAAADTDDTRVRSRVRALIDSIGRQLETDRFARSIVLRLDFRSRPLGEVVDTLNDRHDLGLSLRLGPEPRPGMMVDPGRPKRLKALRDREITLEAAQPLPFWEAIDRLCTAGALRYDISRKEAFGTSQGSLVLMADRTDRGVVSDSGPFRVQIIGVNSASYRDFPLDIDPALRREERLGSRDLNVPLAVLPEPGVMLHQNGAVTVTEATDDRGRSLAQRAPAPFDPSQDGRPPAIMNDHAAIQFYAVLAAPDPPGTVIRRLRGKVPVIAVTRRSDPIVIPLNGQGFLGKPYSTHELTLSVDEASLAPGAPASVKVTFRSDRGDVRPRGQRDPRPPDFTAYTFDRALEHLEFHDAAGRRLNHAPGGWWVGVDGQGYYGSRGLVVSPVFEEGLLDGPRTAKTPIPTELRYYEFVQSVMEIPFDFHDVPMP